ncbi:MAG: SPASM domain-containing protein [Magnetococcales bacterium]|nr:SPASM domain-containing protein [Magnetococcales bacterium]MBF0157733.1 SPASM domain-containing protein [Magnetococcales bacterium]
MNDSPLKGKAAEAFVEDYLGWPLEVLRPFPKFLTIEPINRCNAECIMCGIDFAAKAKATLSAPLFGRMVEEIGRYAATVEKVIIALDGEPLLDRKLASKVRALKEAGVRRVNVTTNASLLTATRGEELIEAGMDEIYITIDSLKKPVYEAIRRGLDFETVLGHTRGFIALRDARKAAVTIRVLMVQQELNRDEPDQFRAYWGALLGERDQVAVQKAHNWARAVQVMPVGDEASINAIPCISLWSTLGIHADGRVGLCCMDTLWRYPLGDLNQQSIAEIWASPAMEAARRLHLDGRRAEIPMCDGCTVWRRGKRQLTEIREKS